jgi:hypothetical protein
MKIMKNIKKFNESWSGNDEEISEESINDFLNNGINVNIFLTDLISDTNVILLMTNGEVYERRSGNKKWNKYTSEEEFKSKTGASLDKEYAGNESPALLNIFTSVDDYRSDNIDKVYIDTQFDNKILDSVLKNFE